MTEIKVGDRVRRTYTSHPEYPHESKGYEFIVGETRDYMVREKNTYHWHTTEFLELVSPVVLPFKVGDRVRRTVQTYYNNPPKHRQAGYTFVVTETDNDETFPGVFDGRYWHSCSYLELVPALIFKVGDRVRRGHTSAGCVLPNHKKGYEFVICKLVNEGEGRGLALDADGCLHELFNLELVPEGAEVPMCIITRRKVVPGKYGIVTVGKSGCVIVSPLYETGEYVPQTAAELREAAHILNQIAEVREEEEAEA